MSLCLFFALLTAASPATLLPASATLASRAPVHTQVHARVKIMTAESIAPMDRKATRKGYDRIVRRKGDLMLVEFF
jgi:hypothetical protein